MEIRVLRYFLAVAEEGSFVKAAKALYISQPSLSRQISQLERELGVPLFERGRQHSSLTEQGIMLKRRAEKIIELTNAAAIEVAVGDILSGSVHIGFSDCSATQRSMKTLAMFSSKHPHVRYNVYIGNSAQIAERIHADELDVGMVTEPVTIGELSSFRLPQQDVWGVAFNRSHPLANRESVSLREISAEPILIPERPEMSGEIKHWCDEEHTQLNICACGNIIRSSLPLVEAGMCCALTIQSASPTSKLSGTNFVLLCPKRTTGNLVIWKQSRTCNSLISEIVKLLKEQNFADATE